ncbi:MAG: ABC transporter ATP-binding protein [Propionibacteriaceae bacterium]|jgi:ABC-2 type transport system ATP-binding protein|nr:ABC transporter ATP-binding protein [Propionibacteriaceae bacterium]
MPGGEAVARAADPGAAPPAAIAVSGLRVVRGRRAVLPDLSLSVAAGRVTGLLGPSGGGKTTLMRAIVGTQQIAGGTVEVLGLPAGAPALRRRVGYMTQAASVYPDLTARENLAYFAALLDVDSQRVDEVIRRVDLESHAHDLVGRLSGGQRSRVSLAVALLGRPEVLVLDEPTVGLDPLLRQSLWELFGQLAAGGTCLLVSSHVMDEAARCDHLVLLRQGRVLADTTPAGLLALTGADDTEAAFLALALQAGGER